MSEKIDNENSYLSSIAQNVLPYDGCGISVALSATNVFVKRNDHCGFESVEITPATEKEWYCVEYRADPQVAARTFCKGTIFGTLEDLASIAHTKQDRDNPVVVSVYTAPALGARIAFDRMFAIFLEKTVC